MSTTVDLDKSATAPTFTGISAGRKARNTVATVLMTLAFLIALVPLVWVIWTVVSQGIAAIASSSWWSQSLNGLLARQAGGGAYHAIVGTLLQGLVCAIIATPIGIMVAIYLVEYGAGTRLARATTFMVDILTGVPSIVAALFVYAVWISIFGLPRSAFAVSLALVLLMLPVVVRSTEEMLRIVPDDLREASYALGVPKWKTIVKVVIPTALSGMLTGIVLALARVMGETAPVLILVAYAPYINFDIFGGNMASLPLMMTVERTNPTDAGADRLWGAAITLILIITIFQLLAAFLSKVTAPKTK
ncbi:MAG: phosphate ABC transporter permease PstA [Pseudonocardia sp.]|uniref:phosphate ABC transporter permease PstA n=1 Tax=unclassified Pseudonocardia TaxID=2619320 RepID=UPI00086B7B4A|nr:MULTISPECIES: phosphate ABC transporter permease PstA [unclassified Pseudonocardia]MBN9111956.1 phosphate ABC transporter permease PstA [Pseudonocardia sp.]ODU24519.1 MAG: phosphate ABC transporter, permease protein PstA [Pseudonocardia sp. SCN 72-51]ODV06701.1 MAG: phosphate ABC transporter, permease protein PstA [Pseudonocardia sp. SCN 73-27]